MNQGLKGTVFGVSLVLGIALLTLTVMGDQNINTVYCGNYFVGNIGESVVATIDCTAYPDLPVKGWELKVRFDPDVVQAVSVEEGDIFQDHMTFFYGGEIDNANGTIINIYAVDLNKTMITETGSVVKITFTVVGQGDSPLELYDVGVCNDSAYVERVVMNGSISFRPVWDLNEDGTCNLDDLQLIAGKLGMRQCNPFLDEDLNKDGVVMLDDLILCAKHWGETY